MTKSNRDIALVIGFSVFIALCSWIWIIPLPFATWTSIYPPVIATLLTGAAVGSRRGALAALLCLAYVAIGMPYARTSGGVTRLYEISSGFLWALPIAAYISGTLYAKGFNRNLITKALAMLPGLLIFYILGFSWSSAWGLLLRWHSWVNILGIWWPNVLNVPQDIAGVILPSILGHMVVLVLTFAMLQIASSYRQHHRQSPVKA